MLWRETRLWGASFYSRVPANALAGAWPTWSWWVSLALSY